MDQIRLTHLRQLEAESIHIIREVAAEFSNPVMLYSIGKDSSVMLHLARKAFYPGTLPFPLLHVDTGWKFREMYEFRDRTAKAYGCELLVHKNPEGVAMGINPFVHGSAKHTDIMKTEGLKQALNKIGVTGMTVTQVMGCGIQKGSGEKYRGAEVDATLLPKVKVEVVVSKIPVEKIIDTATKALYTGHIGDGKIFVYNVAKVVKVRTGEQDYAALQDVE